MQGEINVTKRVWQHIYAVMRLFPDGMSVSDFTQCYSQMFHKSLDYKSCGCRRLLWLLLSLPDVEVVRLSDGSPGIKLIRLPNKH
uniref:HTH OST-type domain-containing protein n=1 Tax=Romanomermis culicivorax TaxID=13658 RepID=A0A915KVZ3_ROMCU